LVVWDFKDTNYGLNSFPCEGYCQAGIAAKICIFEEIWSISNLMDFIF